MNDKIYIGSDHAGFKTKEHIKEILNKLGYDFEDLGTDNENKSVDYPDFAKKVVEKVIKQNKKGILVCGSGNGMQISANRFKGIRAILGYDIYSVKMGRYDNDANILILRSREFDSSKYYEIVKTFLSTEFSNFPRHLNRIKKLDENK